MNGVRASRGLFGFGQHDWLWHGRSKLKECRAGMLLAAPEKDPQTEAFILAEIARGSGGPEKRNLHIEDRVTNDARMLHRSEPYCASARSPLAKACQGSDELIGKLSRLSSNSAVPPIA